MTGVQTCALPISSLFLDGKLQGSLDGPMQFHWDIEKTAIMLGIEYIGDMDELMIFDRALDADALQSVMKGKVTR